jgi:beta-galactosidase beta subunit
MKNFKVDNTIELASELTQLRKNHPQNGKVISKERLSLAMDKGRTWLSQVETRRLKKVDSTDIVKLYSLILDVDIQAAEEKFLEFYEPYIEDLKKFDSVLNKFTVSIKERYSASKTYKEHRDVSLYTEYIFQFYQQLRRF